MNPAGGRAGERDESRMNVWQSGCAGVAGGRQRGERESGTRPGEREGNRERVRERERKEEGNTGARPVVGVRPVGETERLESPPVVALSRVYTRFSAVILPEEKCDEWNSRVIVSLLTFGKRRPRWRNDQPAVRWKQFKIKPERFGSRFVYILLEASPNSRGTRECVFSNKCL